jgi:5'-nucleotidase
MRILITNDDGVHAPGIRALASVARQFGEVIICAPDSERSCCGHSMTMRDPLRVKELEIDGIRAYAVNGLPVDCVNVALTELFSDDCDLVLSGINNGPNLGFDVTYSGTVGGAMEGCINGIRSISLSMCKFVEESPAHFETGVEWITENWELITQAPMERLTFLNVNIPAIASPEIQGHMVVPMGERVYKDRVERRDDPFGRPYWWQGGVVVMDTTIENTDVWAVSQGYVALTPISMNWTAQTVLKKMRGVTSR